MSVTSTFSCSFGSPSNECDILKQSVEIVPLDSCKTDISSYLSSLGVSTKRIVDGESKLTEKDLILNRAGLKLNADTSSKTICPKHRHDLTVGWSGRRRTTCSHPHHKGMRKHVKNIRRVNAQMSSEIHEIFDIVLPIGSGRYILSHLLSLIYQHAYYTKQGTQSSYEAIV